MKHTLNRTEIAPSVNFSYVNDSKFKHNRLSVYFIAPLDINKVSNNAIVPLLLRRGSKNLPDFSALNAKLDMLYGASLNIDISRLNAYQQLSLSINFLDNRYAMDGEDLSKQCADLIIDLIFNPNFGSDGAFNKNAVELERKELIDSIEAEINDKRLYALRRTIEEMYKDEPISVSQYGSIATANKVSAESAAQAWYELISTAAVEVLFTGPGSHQAALDGFSAEFSKVDRKPIEYKLLKLRDVATEVKAVNEELENLSQGKLVMGMRIKGLDTPEQKDAAKVFSAAFGGTPFSKLFLNVREKLGLCYYCAARADSINNLLMVDSGVEKENVEKAKAEILNQLEAMKNGDIAEEELKNTKLLLANAIENIGDTLGGIESWYITQILYGTLLSPEEVIKSYNSITIKQLAETAQNVTLDTVYLLTGKEQA